MHLKKISEIEDLLPPKSWAANHNKLNNGTPETILLIEGDFECHNLNLDTLLANHCILSHIRNQEQLIGKLIVTGHMKANNIWCNNTEDAASLIVLGNLDAANIVVGGQEIYVCGNLNIHGLFWGDNNSGTLSIQGHVNMHTFIATNEYYYDRDRFLEENKVVVSNFFCDEDSIEDYKPNGFMSFKEFFTTDPETVFDRELLEDLLHEDCLIAEEDLEIEDVFSWHDWMLRDVVTDRLKNNQPIVVLED
ncbi:hypothetical protein [Flavobacterium kingsejongi]|uniref:Uncharacterized protein n=1 Tax=Flavobacterium kingsejongi TaxID=1678728 RepID=A0A2S1LPR8_9FLAO|nr:hypothetical protein [Flavobacterium kingsejongi]AWG25750.1 hypothetical protein FK004_11230 [Flavobacterium kingsejongi]